MNFLQFSLKDLLYITVIVALLCVIASIHMENQALEQVTEDANNKPIDHPVLREHAATAAGLPGR